MFCTHGNGPSEDRFCNYIKTFSPCLPSSLSESQRSVKAGNVADVWMDVDCRLKLGVLAAGLQGSGGGGRIILALGDTHQHIHIFSHCCSASFHNSYTNTKILTSSVFKVPISR